MKNLYFIFFLLFIFYCSHDKLAGTTTEVNTGTISGCVLNDGSKYRDSVTVSLYSNDSTRLKKTLVGGSGIESVMTSDGAYTFDSLDVGTYTIKVTKGNLVLGQTPNIILRKGDNLTVNITIVIIINQIFKITNINTTQNVTINNYYFVGANGTVDTLSKGQFVASFIKADTVHIQAEVSTGGAIDTINIIFIRQPDGSYVSMPIITNLPIVLSDGTTIARDGVGTDSTQITVHGDIKEETR